VGIQAAPEPAPFPEEIDLAIAPPEPKRRLHRLIIPALGVALSIAGLAYVYRDFDLGALLASSSRLRLLPFAGTVAAYWVGTVLLRSLLVRHLLRPIGVVGVLATYRYICIGFLANNVLPFRAGDVARSAAIHRGTRMPFSSVVGGLALERMLDMGMVAVIAFLALRFAPLPDAIRTAALGSAGAVAVGLVVVVVLARRQRREADAGGMGPIRAFAWNTWVRFSAGFGAMGSARAIAVAVVLIAAVWAMTLATMACRLEAFSLAASPSLALSLLTCLGFGVAIPSAPGYVGVYHAAAAFALELHGVDHNTAAAFAMFSWLIDVGIGSAIGAASLSIEGMRLGELRRREPATGE
jgi:hypothetical protein